MSRYASRKFLAAIASLLAGTWALAEGLLTGGDYKALVLGTVGLYIAGNVGQKYLERK